VEQASDFIFKEEVYQIVGSCMKVHRGLRAGFLERVCQEALAIVLTEEGITFVKEKQIQINYKGQPLLKN